MTTITVIKRDLHGQETWRYTGHIVQRDQTRLVLEANFNRPDIPFHEITLKEGDRFVETFYTDRWYNIFEIYDREDGQIKGWYCNIGHPAVFEEDTLSYIDLALDLLVYPDGRQLVLDEDEFALLPLSMDQRLQARRALAELQARFRKQLAEQ